MSDLEDIGLQLCAGLQHLHTLEPPYAHNDVKPGNVLLTHRKGQPPLAILMDFGSARPARREIRSRSEALQLQVINYLMITFPINYFVIIFPHSFQCKLIRWHVVHFCAMSMFDASTNLLRSNLPSYY